MQIGFNAPTAGPLSVPDALTRIVVEGEKMGYDYATFSDHVVIPTDIDAKYPYSSTGEFPSGATGERHEQLTEVAYIAAKTTKLRLVTSVMVVPHRPAVLTAKILSTIDVLSGGRLTLGIGAGWMREEFEAIGAPDFDARGKVTDEYLLACKELWTKADPRFAGQHVRFAGIMFEPKPVQKPHPPIWVGGESGPALRRTAKLGDAWYPIGTNPAFPLGSLAQFRAGIDKLHKLTREAGRNPKDVGIALRVGRFGEGVPATASDGQRHLFSGGNSDFTADLRALRDVGVGSVDFGFPGATPDAVLQNMQRFRTDVLAKV
ncbi:MAG: LLM class F420-dependent oxidoreductase [Alphaproteobacteria bacterium]|nr:LLM class F420-dependent oxidoreductase [Alphaproteobacteria bacterium]